MLCSNCKAEFSFFPGDREDFICNRCEVLRSFLKPFNNEPKQRSEEMGADDLSQCLECGDNIHASESIQNNGMCGDCALMIENECFFNKAK